MASKFTTCPSCERLVRVPVGYEGGGVQCDDCDADVAAGRPVGRTAIQKRTIEKDARGSRRARMLARGGSPSAPSGEAPKREPDPYAGKTKDEILKVEHTTAKKLGLPKKFTRAQLLDALAAR